MHYFKTLYFQYVSAANFLPHEAHAHITTFVETLAPMPSVIGDDSVFCYADFNEVATEAADYAKNQTQMCINKANGDKQMYLENAQAEIKNISAQVANISQSLNECSTYTDLTELVDCLNTWVSFVRISK